MPPSSDRMSREAGFHWAARHPELGFRPINKKKFNGKEKEIMTKRMIIVALALMTVGAGIAAVSTRASVTKDSKITGEVVDLPCYEGKNGARGEGHKSCALSCAKKGNQLAIVEKDTNTVYSITGDFTANKNEKLVPFVAETVEAMGEVMEKDGKKSIAVKSMKKAGM